MKARLKILNDVNEFLRLRRSHRAMNRLRRLPCGSHKHVILSDVERLARIGAAGKLDMVKRAPNLGELHHVCLKWTKVRIHGCHSDQADWHPASSHSTGEIDDGIGSPSHVPQRQARQYYVQMGKSRKVGAGLYIERQYTRQLLLIGSYCWSGVREHFATNILEVVYEVRKCKIDKPFPPFGKQRMARPSRIVT